MMKHVVFASLMACVANLGGCAGSGSKTKPPPVSAARGEPKPITNPAVKEIAMLTDEPKVGVQTLTSVQLLFPFELQNPTEDEVKVVSAKWQLKVQTEKDHKGESQLNVTAVPSTTAPGAIEVEIPLDASDKAFATREDMNAMIYDMTATFVVDGPDGEELYEAEWHSDMYAPKKPKVFVEPSIGRYGDMVDMMFSIGVRNLNSFPVNVDSLDFTLYVSGHEVAHGVVGVGERIDPASELRYDFSRVAGREDLHALAREVMGKQEVKWKLKHTLTVGGIVDNKPVDGMVRFSKRR